MNPNKVLYVDDCRMSLLLLKHVLARAGLRVDSAGDGEMGLEMAVNGNYPLVFLDVMLPKIDGFEVCHKIREAPLEHQPRIFMLTAMGEEYAPRKHEEVGADGVFFKPLVPSQIVQVAKEAVALAAASRK